MKRGISVLGFLLLASVACGSSAADIPEKYTQLHDKAAADAGALKQLQGMADKGDAWAQYCLAGLYNPEATLCKVDTLADQTVTTVKPDPKAAVKWYELSARQGNGYAADELAGMYVGESGIPADMVRAAQWWMVAIEADPDGGGFDATISLGAIKGDLTEAQLAKARTGAKKIVAGIKKKH